MGPQANDEEEEGMRRIWRFALAMGSLLLIPLAMAGCVGSPLDLGGFVEFYLRGIGVGGAQLEGTVAASKTPTVKESIPVQITGSIGGLSGSFDVTVGSYGTLTGVAVIKGQKKAALRVEDDSQIAALVESMVLDVTGAEVDVTESKASFKGSQTTGGVKKKYKCKVAWKGTVTSGVSAGTLVSGRLKTKGTIS